MRRGGKGEVDKVASNFAAKEFALAEQRAKVIIDADAKQVVQVSNRETSRKLAKQAEQSISQGAIAAETSLAKNPKAMGIEVGDVGQGVEAAIVVIAGKATKAFESTRQTAPRPRKDSQNLRESANLMIPE